MLKVMNLKLKFGFALVLSIVAGAILPMSANAAPIDETSGYDISWPQCSQVLPQDGAFKIIGVNGGRAFQDNPCFDQQLIWAGGSIAELYLNTGNPGAALSTRWPVGQLTPRVCSEDDLGSLGCSFNYGYNFANYSYLFAELAYLRLGINSTPADTRIWLDVETINSWNLTEPEKNVAALRGAVYYLEQVQKVSEIGFYSVASHWKEITGNTKVFSDYPTWVATGTDFAAAGSRSIRSVEKCTEKISFTGGTIRYVQYIDPDLNLDVNVDCLNPIKVPTTLSNLSPTAGSKSALFKLRGKLLSVSGNPVKFAKVTFRYRGKSYSARTNELGIAKLSVRLPAKSGEYSYRLLFAGNKYFETQKYIQQLTVD